MPQFDPSTYSSQLFWLFITFLSLCLVMTVFLVPNFEARLKKRWNYLNSHWQKSTQSQLETQLIQEESLNLLQQTKTEIEAQFQTTVQEINLRQKQIVDQSYLDSSRELRRFRQKIEEKYLSQEKELPAQAKSLSSSIIGQLTDA